MGKTTTIPQNYKNQVNWILGAYSDAGVSFPDGFQKDAIQNSTGARKTDKFKNWTCDISLVTNEKGTFVVVEDSGTYGLTGENRDAEELRALMTRGEELPESERLSRFTSQFNSGGNTKGGGLYGAGKSVFAVASEEYTYYFDSLRDDGLYVANYVDSSGRVESKAYENDAAKAFIREVSGLEEKKTVGTRVIIVNPKKELKDSIESGSIIPFIQQSWWLIIQRLDNNSSISVNGKPISVPANIKETKEIYELAKPELYSQGYRVKNFGFYVFKDGSNPWSGVSYYRRGMKIGEIDIKDIPEKVQGRYWGYIEVDSEWEDELATIEDNVHFGVSRGKKITTIYQNLRNYCNNKVQECLVRWGYKKDKETEDKKLNDEMRQIAEELQELFDKLKFEDLGKGPQKPDFDVRWQDIKYPTIDSERVTSGDTIEFAVRITSSYTNTKKYKYKLSVVDPATGDIVSSIDSETVSIKPGEVYKKSYVHHISNKNSIQYAENKIALTVKVIGSGRERTKELPYYYDIDKPDNRKEHVDLTLHECVFPREGSRRVNFGESLGGVTYLIENKRNLSLKYKLNISIHNGEDVTKPKILDIASMTGEIKPFEEVITNPVSDIIFKQEDYEPFLSEGVLELRARLIADADYDDYERGDKITAFNYRIFLNTDEKNGKNDAFATESVNAPDDFRRSWYKAGNGRTISINVGHTAYNNVKDYPDIQRAYIKEQMLKQYVLIYLAEGKFDTFGHPGEDFSSVDPQIAADRVIEKIESVYTESLRRG